MTYIPTLPPNAATASKQDVQSTLLAAIATALASPLPVLTGGLTDAQLRSSAVPVSISGSVAVTGTFWQSTQPVSIAATVTVTGPLTDAQLRATSVPVSGPLTDAQLRATAVPISGTVTVDTSALATSAKQDAGNTSLASIDTKLSSQTTAAKQDTGNTSLASIDTKTPALSSGSVPVVGPLTDTQLRASAVPVSGTVTANAGTNLNTSALALESGGNLATLAGAVSASKVQTQVAVALPTGSNVIGKTGIDQTTPGTTNKVFIGTDGTVAVSGSVAVTGTFFQATQPVSGTFFQTTQPVSIATAPVLVAGAAIIGKVGIDQTTPGTTNKVSIGTDGTVAIGTALPAGTNVIGKTTIDQTTPGTTNKVFIGADGSVALVAGSAIIGKVSIDQTTPGTTNLVSIGVDGQIGGKLTNNNAVPAATNVGALTAVANVAPPTLTEGKQQLVSIDLQGNQRCTPGGYPVKIQTKSNVSSGSVASLAKAFDNAVSIGSTIVVSCACGNVTAMTVTDSLGNTYTSAVTRNSAALGVAVFYARSSFAGTPTITVANNGAAASMAMTIYELGGVLDLVPGSLDTTSSSNATSTAITSGVGVVPNFANEIGIAAIGVGTAAQTVTVTTSTQGWVSDSGQQNPSTPAGLFSFVSVSAINAQNSAMQAAGTITSEPWACAMATFRPAVMSINGVVRIKTISAANGTLIDLPIINGGAGDSVNISIGTGANISDGLGTNVRSQNAGGGGNAFPMFVPGLVTNSANASTNVFMQRTPSTFKTLVGNAANGRIWTPTVTKKFRIMKYRIQTSAGMKATAAGEYFLNFNDGASGASVTGAPGLGHMVFIPSTAATTLAGAWDSGWIDLGNGYLSLAVGNVLSLGLNGALSSTTVNAGFTQTSGQWAAGQLLFVTNGGATTYGPSAILMQTNSFTPASTAAPTVAFTLPNFAGNTLVIIVRLSSTAKTLAISDTLGNSFVAVTAIDNATDGSRIAAYHCVNCKGGVNTVTISWTGAVQAEMLGFEYQGITAFDTSSGTTGNSTTPAPGNATAASTSALVIGYAGNAQNANPIAAAGAYSLRNSSSNASGSLSVEDNLNQGIAGIVGMFTVTLAGTEE